MNPQSPCSHQFLSSTPPHVSPNLLYQKILKSYSQIPWGLTASSVPYKKPGPSRTYTPGSVGGNSVEPSSEQYQHPTH